MTDWKMPEWLREIITGFRGDHIIEWVEREMHKPVFERSIEADLIFELTDYCRSHRLLSTPSEQDEQEKRIEELKDFKRRYEDLVPFAKLADVERENCKYNCEQMEKRIGELEAEVESLKEEIITGR